MRKQINEKNEGCKRSALGLPRPSILKDMPNDTPGVMTPAAPFWRRRRPAGGAATGAPLSVGAASMKKAALHPELPALELASTPGSTHW